MQQFWKSRRKSALAWGNGCDNKHDDHDVEDDGMIREMMRWNMEKEEKASPWGDGVLPLGTSEPADCSMLRAGRENMRTSEQHRKRMNLFLSFWPHENNITKEFDIYCFLRLWPRPERW